MFLSNTRNRQSQYSIQMKFELVQVLCIGKCYHTCIMRTRRKFREINSIVVTQEKFNSPKAITSQRFSNFCRHLLSLSKMFRSNVSRLEAFAIVTTFLYVSDRRTEQCRTIFLCNCQQRDFAVELNKLFHDQLLNITTAAFTSVCPRVFQIFRTFGYRLSLTR